MATKALAARPVVFENRAAESRAAPDRAVLASGPHRLAAAAGLLGRRGRSSSSRRCAAGGATDVLGRAIGDEILDRSSSLS